MGVDAVILSKGTWTEATAGNLQAYLPEGSRLYVNNAAWQGDTDQLGYRIYTPFKGIGYIEMVCHQRLYSESYPRGHWPTIANAIEAMRLTFGNVYYSGDYFADNARLIEEVGEWIQEQSAELWRVWNKQQEYEQAEHEESVLTRLKAWINAEIEPLTQLGGDAESSYVGQLQAHRATLNKLRELRDNP